MYPWGGQIDRVCRRWFLVGTGSDMSWRVSCIRDPEAVAASEGEGAGGTVSQMLLLFVLPMTMLVDGLW